MRLLVLGGSGMAGHVLATYFTEAGHDVTTLSARHKFNDQTFLVDVTDQKALLTFLDQHTFDVVVNCIGLLVKPSEDHKDLAVTLNSHLPHLLESYYANSKTKLIHLSTDCVFSGKNPPYREDSLHDGELFYDRSKALGEVINDKDLTFRMSIIGPDMQKNGVGLFNWFYAQQGQISGYTKVIWGGITTIELARGIDQAIKDNLTGLYHLVPQANISKYDLLGLFKSVFGRDDITIDENDAAVSDKTLINTRTDFNFKVNDYETMVQNMRQWIIDHKELYPHYKGKGDLGEA